MPCLTENCELYETQLEKVMNTFTEYRSTKHMIELEYIWYVKIRRTWKQNSYLAIFNMSKIVLHCEKFADNLSFRTRFPKDDKYTEGTWLIHGILGHEDNVLQLEPPL